MYYKEEKLHLLVKNKERYFYFDFIYGNILFNM